MEVENDNLHNQLGSGIYEYSSSFTLCMFLYIVSDCLSITLARWHVPGIFDADVVNGGMNTAERMMKRRYAPLNRWHHDEKAIWSIEEAASSYAVGRDGRHTSKGGWAKSLDYLSYRYRKISS